MFLHMFSDLRRAAGLSQAKLAFLLDVSLPTVWNYENGRTEPNASMIRKLAWALRTDETTIIEAVIRAKQAATA